MASSAITIFIFGLCAGGISFWQPSETAIIPALRYYFVISAILFLISLFLKPTLKLLLSTQGFALGLLLVFLSDWLTRSYNFHQGPEIRGEIILFSLISLLIIKNKTSWIFNLLPFFTSLICIHALLKTTGNQTIFSDDHASFLFRLESLKQNFPFIPFYNPLWNGGLDARDFFATGCLNFFFIFSPIIYFFDIFKNYNYLISALIFIILPSSCYAAAKILRAPSPVPAISATVSMTTGSIWYRWALSYGTVGFLTSISLLPLVFALTSKFLDSNEKLSKKQSFVLVIGFTLMLFWSASGIIFLPLFALAGLKILTLIRKKYFISTTLLLSIINIPWIVLFLAVSNVGNFVQKKELPQNSTQSSITNPETSIPPTKEISLRVDAEKLSPEPNKSKTEFSLKKSLKVIRNNAISSNTLLLFLTIPGIFLLPKFYKYKLGITLAWLVLLGSFLATFKPQLELERMLIAAAMLACLPAANALWSLVNQNQILISRFLPALACGFLFSAPFVTTNILQNGTLNRIYLATENVSRIVEQIKQHAQNGRVLFSGFVLHELDEGHIAPLATLSEKPIIASSPFHNKWRYEQVFPKEYLERGREGINEYLNLYNISVIFAHEKYWQDYFSAHKDDYELLWQGEQFWLYSYKKFSNNYFYSGTGNFISQSNNSVSLSLSSSDAILKFNYFNFLKVSSSNSACQILPEKISPSLTFIKLRDCPIDEAITVKSISPWGRLIKEYEE